MSGTVCHHCGARGGMGAIVTARGAAGLPTCAKAACQASAMRAAEWATLDRATGAIEDAPDYAAAEWREECANATDYARFVILRRLDGIWRQWHPATGEWSSLDDLAPYDSAPIEASGAIEDAAAHVAALCEDSSVTNREASAVVDWCRDWARDCAWQDADSIEDMPLGAFLAACDRHLSGGIGTALADCRRMAREDANREDAAPCDCGAVVGASGGYVAHAAGAAGCEDADRIELGIVNLRRESAGLAPIAPDCLAAPIEEYDLGVRAYNIAKRRGIDTGADLLAVTIEDANRWAREGMPLGLPAARQIIEAQDWLRAQVADQPYTAIYRAAQGADRSIYEQCIAASSMREALAIADREATARGLATVALAVGKPAGFGAAILAAGIEDAAVGTCRVCSRACGSLDAPRVCCGTGADNA